MWVVVEKRVDVLNGWWLNEEAGATEIVELRTPIRNPLKTLLACQL